MLNDLRRLLDREPPNGATELDFRDAAQALLRRQFLYVDQERDARHYRLVVRHQEYFRNLFDAIGWQIHEDQDFGLVGLLPDDEENYLALDLEQTLVLFVARLMFEEGIEAHETREGCVHAAGEDLLARYEALTHRERPRLPVFRDILKLFRRHGLVRLGEDDPVSRLPSLALLPALRLIAGDRYLERLEAHLRNPDSSAQGTDDKDAAE
jgi:hypothetical protein